VKLLPAATPWSLSDLLAVAFRLYQSDQRGDAAAIYRTNLTSPSTHAAANDGLLDIPNAGTLSRSGGSVSPNDRNPR